MQMKKILLVITGLLLTGSLIAQQKQLTMEDAMINARTSLAPENLRQLQFIKGTNDYVYVKKINGTDTWVTGNFKSKEESVFLTLSQFNDKLRAASMDTVTGFPAMQIGKDNWVTTIKGQKMSFNAAGGQKVLIEKSLSSKEHAEESADGYVAYVDDFNLYVSKDGKSKKVTEDGSRDIVYASSVHREEFGITKGTFWSNNGKLLAFYRMDQTMVTDYPIIDWSQRPAKNEPIKYPMAGDKSHHVTVGVYQAETEKTVWIKTSGPAEQYLTNIAWSPDDKFVYIVVVNRGQDHLWMNQYNASTGEFVKTLFEEDDSKYVEPLVPMLFLKNKPGQFIWQSQRDGWNHLYLYETSGNLVKQLTKGNWEVIAVKDFDNTGEHLFYTSTEISPLARDLFKLNLKSGKSQRITKGDCPHNTQVSADGSYVIDSYSTLDNPRTIQLTETRSGKTKLLLQSGNPLKDYMAGKPDVFTIKNNQGTDLYCRLYKPANFDSSKRYPVIVYWYGGSHAQLVSNGWNTGAGDYWFHYLAERGYLVFGLDTRGSDNRGKVFEQSMFRKVGAVQMEDMMSAVNFLYGLPYADRNNMGLFGWSFGGFNTIDFMLNYPLVFKAAVAGGPVTDWKYYEVMYTERYMDMPQQNPEGYAATDLVKQVDKLKGKLLLIHGLQDPVVVQQHSVNFVKAAVDKGIQVDYMIYPGHEHNVLGKDRVHLYQKVTDYFMQQLH
jgi:dipeptidyl-peptidase-4